MPPQSSARPIQVGIAIVQCQGRYLVGQRAAHLPLGGLWEFPGGKVEVDESPRAAAQRECREETGLSVAITDCLLVHEHQYEHGRVRLHFFAGQLAEEAGDAHCPSPRTPYRWITREELAVFEFPAGNQILLRQLLHE